MCKEKEEARKRLERCKTCTKPKENGGCSGNLGLGCIGDWRCCLEMDAVCKDCQEHCKDHYLYCDKTDCPKMEKFKNE